MSLANSMFVILILLNFGGGLCGDDWPDRINCPAGMDQEYFNWAIKKSPFPSNVFVSRDFSLERRSLTDASSNFSRSSNCGDSSSINLCHKKDLEECVLGKTSLCVRSTTVQGLIPNSTALVGMHDYHCDGVGNQLYYALTLYRVGRWDSTSNWPQNLETEIDLVSTSGMLYARFYLFRYLPSGLGDEKPFFAAGFVYLKVSLLSVVTGVDVGRLPGNEWPKWVKCSAEFQEETYDWAITEIPDHLIVQRNFSDLKSASSHQNFTRVAVCGSEINLCNPDEDLEICVFDITSLCVRSTTSEHPLFQEPVGIFATHDHHCDGKGNQFYYAFALFQVPKMNIDAAELPPNIKPEINMVSILPNVRTTYARFYLFHLLPDLLQDDNMYCAVGFVYLQGSVETAVTGVVSNTAPGSSLQHT